MKINSIFDDSACHKVRIKNLHSIQKSMARVKFTSALKRFFPSITEMEIHGGTWLRKLFLPAGQARFAEKNMGPAACG